MANASSVFNVLKIGTFLALEAPVRPRWAYYRLRTYTYAKWLTRRHRQRVAEYQEHVRPLEDGLAYVLDRELADVQRARQNDLLDNLEIQERYVVGLGAYDPNRPLSKGPIEVRYGPSPQLMAVINVVCTLVRPKTVVETGVAKGFSTVAALDAVERNGHGHVWSIELPSLYAGYMAQVGERIPDRLRAHWTLETGPSAIVLPRLGRQLGSIDVFMHDSAVNYDNQSTEYAAALAAMPKGGVLISALLTNDAFLETVERTECRWTVIEQSKIFPIGVLCKLG